MVAFKDRRKHQTVRGDLDGLKQVIYQMKAHSHLVHTPVMTSYRLVMIYFWLADDEHALPRAIIFKMIKMIPLFSHQKHTHTWT